MVPGTLGVTLTPSRARVPVCAKGLLGGTALEPSGWMAGVCSGQGAVGLVATAAGGVGQGVQGP